MGRGEGAQSFPGISKGLPSAEVGWDGQRGNHTKPSHAPETKSPISTSFPPSAKELLVPHPLRAFRCGTGVFGQPHHRPGSEHGEGLELRELGQGTGGAGASRRRCPGQAGPRGLGVAVPPLQEFPPVGVIGYRLGAGRDAVMEACTQMVWGQPRRVPLQARSSPHPCWLGDPGQSPEKHLVCPPRPALTFQILQNPPADTPRRPWSLPVGRAWTGSVRRLETPRAPGFLAVSGHPGAWGPESLSRVWDEQMNFPGAPR